VLLVEDHDLPLIQANLVVKGGWAADPIERLGTGSLTADDGTQGTYTATWVENRVAAATVVCNGNTYLDVWMGETPEVTSAVKFPEWGSAELVTTGHVVVYRSSRNGSSPSICDETTGGSFTFEFTNGPITQLMSGTWHRDETSHLVFDVPILPSPSPSASAGLTVSTAGAAPSEAAAVKTFGRREKIFTAVVTFTSINALPAYTGRVATMSPCSVLMAVQSAAIAALSRAETLGPISFPIWLAGKKITPADSFAATSEKTFDQAVVE